MIETIVARSDGNGVAVAAQLLHDFNMEYDEPTPPPGELAVRLEELIDGDQITVLVAREHDTPRGGRSRSDADSALALEPRT